MVYKMFYETLRLYVAGVGWLLTDWKVVVVPLGFSYNMSKLSFKSYR